MSPILLNFNRTMASGECIHSANVSGDTYRELAAHHAKYQLRQFSLNYMSYLVLTSSSGFYPLSFYNLIPKLNPHSYRDTFFGRQPTPSALFCFVTPGAAAIDYGTIQPLHQSKSPTHSHRAFSYPLQRVTRAVYQWCFGSPSILATSNKHDP